MLTIRPLLAALLACVSTAALADRPSVIGVIPGTDGAWDYASVDTATNTLFVAHGDTIAGVDLTQPLVSKTFAPAHRAHAVLPIPGRHEILVTDGDSSTARLIDVKTGRTRATIAMGLKPDAAIWDAKRMQAVVMNAKSGTVVTIDAASAKITSTITLKPGLEFAAFDGEGLLYINNEDDNDISIVDLGRARLVAKVALPGCKGPTGMAWAPKAKRIVSSCDGVATLFDPVARKVTGSIPIGEGPDAVISDATRNRLFIPSGKTGTMAVLSDTVKGVELIRTIQTAIGARTGAVDPRTGHVYLPVADFASNPDGGRPTPLPGTFRILIIDPVRH